MVGYCAHFIYTQLKLGAIPNSLNFWKNRIRLAPQFIVVDKGYNPRSYNHFNGFQ